MSECDHKILEYVAIRHPGNGGRMVHVRCAKCLQFVKSVRHGGRFVIREDEVPFTSRIVNEGGRHAV